MIPLHRSTRRLAATALAATLVALAGCATGPRTVPAEVTTFDDWSSLPADRAYVFARTLEYRNSLEVRSDEAMVADELARRGFRQVADPTQASLVVTLRPSVTGATVQLQSWPGDPFWGPYVGAYGGFYGNVYGRRYGWYDPGWYAADFGATALRIYQRRLELDIDSRIVPGKRYYEGRAETSGGSDSLPQAMPVLIRALFTDFPGNDGQTRRVDVAADPSSTAAKP